MIDSDWIQSAQIMLQGTSFAMAENISDLLNMITGDRG